MSFLRWTKILPFFILKRLDSGANRKNPVWITFFEGYDPYTDEPKYKEVKADIAMWFPGTYVFTSERYELEKKEQEYEKKLKCVKDKLKE
jgi:hypothetical protein